MSGTDSSSSAAPRTRLTPMPGPEPWRSLQPVIDAELSWGNRLSLDWMRGLHDDTWVAHLQGPKHVDLLTERFELGEGISLRHEARGWTLVDGPGRVFLVSQDVGVVMRPGGREVDTGLVARTLGWLDRKLNGGDTGRGPAPHPSGGERREPGSTTLADPPRHPASHLAEPPLDLSPAPPELRPAVEAARRAARAAGARDLRAVLACGTDAPPRLLLVTSVRGCSEQVAQAAVAAVRQVAAQGDLARHDAWVLSGHDLSYEWRLQLAKVDYRSEMPTRPPVSRRGNWALGLSGLVAAGLTQVSPLVGALALAGWLLVALTAALRGGARPPGWARRGSGRPVGWVSLAVSAAAVVAACWQALRALG